MLSNKTTTKTTFGFDYEEEDGEEFYTFMISPLLYWPDSGKKQRNSAL